MKRAARVGAALAGVACLFASVPSDAASKEVKAEQGLLSYTFKPATIRVDVDETVTWTNETGIDHTVTSGSFNGTLPAQGQPFSHKFTQPGTYAYYCSIHGLTGMTGTVVSGPDASPSVTPTPTSGRSSQSPSPAVTRTIKPSPSPTPTPSAAPSPSPSPAASPTPTASPTPSSSATPSASASPDEPLGASPTSGGGSNVPLVVGIVGLLVAAGAGAGLLWLRRQPGGPPSGGGVP